MDSNLARQCRPDILGRHRDFRITNEYLLEKTVISNGDRNPAVAPLLHILTFSLSRRSAHTYDTMIINSQMLGYPNPIEFSPRSNSEYLDQSDEFCDKLPVPLDHFPKIFIIHEVTHANTSVYN
jgi:hypothetical protein